MPKTEMGKFKSGSPKSAPGATLSGRNHQRNGKECKICKIFFQTRTKQSWGPVASVKNCRPEMPEKRNSRWILGNAKGDKSGESIDKYLATAKSNVETSKEMISKNTLKTKSQYAAEAQTEQLAEKNLANERKATKQRVRKAVQQIFGKKAKTINVHIAIKVSGNEVTKGNQVPAADSDNSATKEGISATKEDNSVQEVGTSSAETWVSSDIFVSASTLVPVPFNDELENAKATRSGSAESIDISPLSFEVSCQTKYIINYVET